MSSAAQGPGGLVSLVVGETGRSSSAARGRARPGAGSGPGPGEATVPAAHQWCCRWTADGPGTVTAGCDGEPDLALSLSPTDAALVKEGKLAPSVAFMQGRLKTSGDNALLLRVLEWTATPAFPAALAAWEADVGRLG